MKREDEQERVVPTARCWGCAAIVPWPAAKQPKASHRIIGLTARGEPLCNQCYERSPENDWRAEAMRDFAERHINDDWAILYRMAVSLKDASKEDKAEVLGYIRAQIRKASIGTPLPYDKAQMGGTNA